MALKKEQVKSAAATYTTEPEQEHKAQPKEKKIGISFYLRPSVYERVKHLARFQGVAAGTLIDEALNIYLDEHQDEIEAFEKLTAKLQAKKEKKNSGA